MTFVVFYYDFISCVFFRTRVFCYCCMFQWFSLRILNYSTMYFLWCVDVIMRWGRIFIVDEDHGLSLFCFDIIKSVIFRSWFFCSYVINFSFWFFSFLMKQSLCSWKAVFGCLVKINSIVLSCSRIFCLFSIGHRPITGSKMILGSILST